MSEKRRMEMAGRLAADRIAAFNCTVHAIPESPGLALPCPTLSIQISNGPYTSPVSDHSSDLPNFRLIASRTSVPPSLRPCSTADT